MSPSSLAARVCFTIGALLIYRLGTYIPVPGFDPAVMAEAFNPILASTSGYFYQPPPPKEEFSIFALGVFPYLFANAIVLMAAAFSMKLRASVFRGQGGYKKIEPYVRYLTVLVSAIQALFLARWLQDLYVYAKLAGIPFGSIWPITPDSGLVFQITTVITLTAATLFLVWLAEQMTRHGVGVGIPLIICARILTELPESAASVLRELTRASLIGLLIVMVAAVVLVVFVERARRRVLVEFPKQRLDGKIVGGSSSHIPLELNAAGVIPAILASALLPLLSIAAGLVFLFYPLDDPAWLVQLARLFGLGQPLYLVVYACLIVFFTLLCGSIRLNPTDAAENLQKRAGFIPGIRPGEKTAEYLRYFQVRLGAVAAAYLILICVLPEVAAAVLALPLNLSGFGLLVVVWVILDTTKRVHWHLLERRHENSSG